MKFPTATIFTGAAITGLLVLMWTPWAYASTIGRFLLVFFAVFLVTKIIISMKGS